MILKDAYKGYTLDLAKIIPPKETVRRFKKKLKKINLSILEKTTRIDNGRLDIPVYFSICGHDAEDVIGTKKQKGA
jgi:ribosomal protein S12 methylthiotransferase accessory factor